MGRVRANAAILSPLILDRIADERLPSVLRSVSCPLELNYSRQLQNAVLHREENYENEFTLQHT